MKNNIKNWIFNKDYDAPNIDAEMVDIVKKYNHITTNSFIADEIMKEIGLEAEYKRTLESIVYHARHIIEAEKKSKQDADMIKDGWSIIPVRELFTYRGQITIRANKSSDWLTTRIDTIGKVIDDGDKKAFFIPKGKRTRGYYLSGLKGYYKINN